MTVKLADQKLRCRTSELSQLVMGSLVKSPLAARPLRAHAGRCLEPAATPWAALQAQPSK